MTLKVHYSKASNYGTVHPIRLQFGVYLHVCGDVLITDKYFSDEIMSSQSCDVILERQCSVAYKNTTFRLI